MAPLPEHVIDITGASWLPPQLGAFGSSVAGFVPPLFEAYARVGSPGWTMPPENENGLASEVLAVLCELIAARHAVNDCWFALWEDYGWMWIGHRGSVQVAVSFPEGQEYDQELVDRAQAEANMPVFPLDVLEGPKLRLPNRDYLVFRGPLASALTFGEKVMGGPFPPDLLWPDDREWFIGTDVSQAVAYVGGNHALIADILNERRIASEAIHADDAIDDSTWRDWLV